MNKYRAIISFTSYKGPSSSSDTTVLIINDQENFKIEHIQSPTYMYTIENKKILFTYDRKDKYEITPDGIHIYDRSNFKKYINDDQLVKKIIDIFKY
jgi:hypothetical protein